jgi:hypothetical protein
VLQSHESTEDLHTAGGHHLRIYHNGRAHLQVCRKKPGRRPHRRRQERSPKGEATDLLLSQGIAYIDRTTTTGCAIPAAAKINFIKDPQKQRQNHLSSPKNHLNHSIQTAYRMKLSYPESSIIKTVEKRKEPRGNPTLRGFTYLK